MINIYVCFPLLLYCGIHPTRLFCNELLVLEISPMVISAFSQKKLIKKTLML